MPTAAARRLYEDQIPSFMSVFDLVEAMQDRDTVTVVDPNMMEIEPTCNPQLPSDSQQILQPPNAIPLAQQHQHNDSTSTQAFESADSSPTTTVSCTDSSSLSDPSPSSSPDSPVNLVPLNAFPSTTFGALPSMATLTVSEPQNNLSPPSNLSRPMTSPSPRRPRNMKGLSIQPPHSALASTSLMSEPVSPAFIKPKIPSMKRKPSQLSLNTNSSDLLSRPTLEVPSSPSIVPAMLQRRALKHSMSSPHMLSGLKSSTFGPAGGMTFPPVLERNESGLSEFFRPSKPTTSHGASCTIVEEDSPIRSQIANRAAYDFEPYHEKENNEDQQSPGYPDGPIAIYGDNVFLYLEPTADIAAKFDVVINVAKEVENPFDMAPSGKEEPQDQDLSPVPDTAATNASFATAFEFMPEDLTPTTPKAMFPSKSPEYIHVPWDHNTDIGLDLMTLCETIERKTKEGKKVLVHCQQGASRSASLIIAYGLYLNPELSVNDAYYAAQAKSRWISPNMRLMYCLQDFQKEVAKRRLSPGSAYKPRSGRSSSKHRMTLSADAIDISPKEPRTAPLPEEEATSNASPDKSPMRPRGNSTPSLRAISPGPSSAPSSFTWAEKEDEFDPGRFGRFDHAEIFGSLNEQTDSGFSSLSSNDSFPKPPPSPGFGARRFGNRFRDSQNGFGFAPLNFGSLPREEGHESPAPLERPVTVTSSFADDAALMSPRVETMTNNPLHGSFAEFSGMRFVEVPPTPRDQFFSPRHAPEESLFSPRATMFPRDPFRPFGRPPQVADPRSPPTKGETPIVRSIDEII